jgi:pyruvate dehydrogenase E2 component (dihydrolipoamide acetyltransferase)
MKFSAAVVLACLAATAVDAFTAPQNAFYKRPLTQMAMVEGTKITMPALSSTMKEGRVVSWLKSEGDEIEAGEAIMVVESDKADMDVEAFEDGFLAKIIVGEGEMAPVGDAVALIASSASEIDAVIASFSTGGASAPAAPAETVAPSGGGELMMRERLTLSYFLY